jgi:NTE family protein
MNIFNIFKRRKRVAISARGGGAKCAAYIGVIKALEENNVPIDLVIGSSGGATALMPYAFGFSVEETTDFAKMMSNHAFMGVESIKDLSLWSQEKWIKYFDNIFKGKDLRRSKIKAFVQLSRKNDGTNVIKEKGKVSELLVATLAYPGLLPVEKMDEGSFYDGDFTSDFAVPFLRKHRADIIIGLGVFPAKHYSNVKDVDDLDIFINGLGLPYSRIDFSHVDELVDHGYELTMQKMPEIISLL